MDRFFRKGDILVLALTAVAFFLLFFAVRSGGSGTATVTVDGKPYGTYSLKADRVITLDTVPAVTLEIRDGTIAFVNAHCPDKVCERAGRLSHPGDTAACVPAGVAVTVTGGDETGPDAVAY